MLQQVSERVYVVGDSSNKGLIAGETGLIAVDTGLDDTHAKRLLKAAGDLGRPIVAVLTTHAHADHIGGHAWLVRRTGCRIYAPEGEEVFLRHPILQPFSLYGGALPPDALRAKFLLGEPSPVDVVVRPGPMEVDGVRIEAVPLPGHSPGQMGYRVDRVLFTGDAFFATEALRKHYTPYCVDLDEAARSLDTVTASQADIFVPGHGPLLTQAEMAEAVAAHRQRLEKLCSRVLSCLGTPLTADELTASVVAGAGGQIPDDGGFVLAQGAVGFVLARSAILACLVSLERAGRVEDMVEGNLWRWRTRE